MKDSQEFGGLDIAASVPLWMHTSAQVSVGGRKQVLEDRGDLCNSESDSDHEDRGDELTGSSRWWRLRGDGYE
jgi:hypothetical protein